MKHRNCTYVEILMKTFSRRFYPLHAHRGLGRINWMAGAINLLKNIVIWEIDLTPLSAIIPFRQSAALIWLLLIDQLV